MQEKKENKDMILRDHLAVDRTHLANQRTLLAMTRTGLYFIVMGLTVLTLDHLVELKKYSILFFITGCIFLLMGILNYQKMKKKIKMLYK